MARQLKRLTARRVATLTKPGRHADGGNLYLMISKAGEGLSKRWTFLYVFNGRQREAGFGSAATVTLAEAREKASECRSMLARSIDPLDAKKAASDAAAARQTFGQCADDLIKSKRSEWRNAEHARQWVATLKDYCKSIRDVPVDEIDTAAVLTVLKPLWSTIPETAARLRGRIEAILNAAKARGLRTGENPAAWRGHLDHLLPRRHKLTRGHLPATPYDRIPDLMARLHEGGRSIPSFALEFAILTAVRSGEVLGARWSEIDVEARLWTIPATRMKAGKEHRVPLSGPALAILARVEPLSTGGYVFPGQRRRKPCNEGALRYTLKQIGANGTTVHGFRSSFRDWAGEETSFSREVAEQALAHATGGAVERAYRRGDALEKRRALMEAWAQYCEPGAGGNMIPIKRTAN